MLLLVASVVALLVGPALARVAGERRGPLAMVDGFIVAALLGIVVFDVLPEALEHAGALAIVAGLVGVALPRLLEGRLHVAEGQLHGAVTWGAVLGYSLHATLDGAALVGSSGLAGALGLGVVLHRVPVGVTMWWLVRPRHGVRGAALAVFAIGAATALGFFGAERVVGALPLGTIGVFQALVGGSLLHVVAGHGHGDDTAPEHPRWSLAGALAAVACIAGVAHAHEGEESHGAAAMVEFARLAAPWVFASVLLLVLARPAKATAFEGMQRRFGGWLDPLQLGGVVVSFGLMGPMWGLVRVALALLGIAVVHALAGEPRDVRDADASPRLHTAWAHIERNAGQLALGAVAAGLLHAGGVATGTGSATWVAGAVVAAWAVPMSALASVTAALALQPISPAAALVLSVVAPLGSRRAMRFGERRVGQRRALLAVTAGSVAVGLAAASVSAFAPSWVAGVTAPEIVQAEPHVHGWRAAGAPMDVLSTLAVVAMALVLASTLVRSGPRALVSALVEPDGDGHEHVHVEGTVDAASHAHGGPSVAGHAHHHEHAAHPHGDDGHRHDHGH